MFYKNFCYIKQNYLLILFLYACTITFVLMTHARNEEAAYDIKGINLNEVLNHCKNLMLKLEEMLPGSDTMDEKQFEL